MPSFCPEPETFPNFKPGTFPEGMPSAKLRTAMADVHNKATRSFNMSRIKGKNTKPEMLVRRFLLMLLIVR